MTITATGHMESYATLFPISNPQYLCALLNSMVYLCKLNRCRSQVCYAKLKIFVSDNYLNNTMVRDSSSFIIKVCKNVGLFSTFLVKYFAQKMRRQGHKLAYGRATRIYLDSCKGIQRESSDSLVFNLCTN